MTTQTDIRTLYLEATQELDGDSYKIAEEGAWAELQVALGRLPRQPLDTA
jgi:hypothetical protein